MPLTLSDAKVSCSSYAPGEEFTLRLRFNSPAEGLDTVSNLSVDIFRTETARNQQALGFGHQPVVQGDELTITQALPADIRPGLHFVGSGILSWADRPGQDLRVRFGPIFFKIRADHEIPFSPQDLAALVERVSQEREAHAHKEIDTHSAGIGQPTSVFRVLVLGVGCLLHAPQPLEGFKIYPLQRGFSYGRMLEIANQALRATGIKQISFDQQTEGQHEQATPTFAIEYWAIRAVDHQDALNHCRRHADLMFDLLGLDRGQKPREFFCAAVDHVTGQYWWTFSYPGYAGNLVSDFNPVSTANLIETVTPRLEMDPFLRLLVRSYAEATAERDPGIAMLRAWTVLELLSDRAIQKGRPVFLSDGTAILNAKGNPRDTNAKEARVYEFINSSGAGFPIHSVTHVDGVEQRFLVGADEKHPGFTPGTRVIPLWDLIRATYAIRNRVAHEGYFSEDSIDPADADEVLAADLIKNTPIDPRRWVSDQAGLAVRRELNKP